MKFRFLALGLAATLAGVVGAQALRSHPAKTWAVASSPEQSQPSLTALPHQASTPTVRNALAMDVGRAPVPVLVSHHRDFIAEAEPVATAAASNVDTVISAKMTETTAKAAIEADGYRGVHAMARGSDGTWRALAMRGGTEVSLTVEAAGSVSAN
jgi:hypothetical protein